MRRGEKALPSGPRLLIPASVAIGFREHEGNPQERVASPHSGLIAVAGSGYQQSEHIVS